MLKKLLYLFIGLVFSASITKAQISNYKFSSTTGGAAAFQQISAPTLTIVPNCGYTTQQGDEGYANAVPIGFTFNYLGTAYTSLNIATNGFVTFGASGFASGANCTYDNTNGLSLTPAATVSANRPILAPLWDDIDVTGGIQVLTTGVAPLRVFTIQWLNAKWDFSSTAAISFQVKLYETSNIIEFIYRQEAGAVVNASGGASIGICATATGANNFQSLGSAGANPVVSLTTETANIGTKPATGQIYSWDPLYCAARGLFLTGGEKISNVTFANINNSSTSVAEYENFTTVSSGVTPSNTYNLSVTLANSYSGDKVYCWIDYNANGSFTDPGEAVFTSATGAGPFLNNPITIPATATLGYTRMRLRLDDTNGAPSNATPCGDAQWGQVEDYTLLIQTCATASGAALPATQTVCTGSATITSNATGTGITQQWQVSTDGGANFTDLTNVAPYSGVTTATLTINPVAAGLNNYQYRVKLGGTCTPANTFTSAATLKTLAVAPTISPAAPTICFGSVPQALTVTAPSALGAPVNVTFTSTDVPKLVPDGVAAGINSVNPVSGIPAGAVINSMSVNFTMTHTWDSDMGINLVAPNGQVLNLVNRRGGSGDNFTNTTISSTGVVAIASGTAPFTGTYSADAAIGVGATSFLSTAANFAALYSTPNGTYQLSMRDYATPDPGNLVSWSITINYSPSIPQPVIWTPSTNLYTDAAGTINYTGTALSTVYYKPSGAGSFSVSASYTAAPCVSEAKVVPIVVNTPVSITTQPANAAACTVQGTAVFTVVATGSAPITYQWQVDNGTGFANVANGGGYAGATTPTLTLTNIPIGWNGFKYRCAVTGAAPCGVVNTNGAATLTVNPLPTITLNASPYRNLFPGLVTTITATSVPAAAPNGHTWTWSGGSVSTTGNSISGIDVDRMGDYSVRVVDINGCISTSGIISILDSVNGKVFIYPSPNKGQFQVRYYSVRGNQLARSLTVFDSKGSKVYSELIPINRPYGRMDVNLSNVGTGIYTVELSDANGRRINTGRVVVIR